MKTIKAWAVVNRRGLLRGSEWGDTKIRLPYCVYRTKREACEVADEEITKADVVRVEIREVTR